MFVLATASLGVACGLSLSPGDYGQLRGPATDGGVTFDGDVPPVPEGGARVLIVAGRRESFGPDDTSPFVAETMLTTVSVEGKLGPVLYDRSPPYGTTYQRMVVGGGNVYAQTDSRVIYAPIADRLTGEWRELQLDGLPESYLRPWLVTESTMLAAGGYSNNGTTSSSWTSNVYHASLSADAGADWQMVSTSRLVVPRGEVTLFRYQNFVYAIGGVTGSTSSSTMTGREYVEVAPLLDGGLPGPFTATEKLVNPATQGTLGIIGPTVAAVGGYLFVIGGMLSRSDTSSSGGSGSGGSDVVLAAKIDEATGKLDKWIAAPKLPGPLVGAAAFSYQGRLFVVGGSGATALSNAVLALSVSADGKFDSDWQRVGSLPVARGDLGAVIY